jgi:hypothetical protein
MTQLPDGGYVATDEADNLISEEALYCPLNGLHTVALCISLFLEGDYISPEMVYSPASAWKLCSLWWGYVAPETLYNPITTGRCYVAPKMV